MTETRTDRDAIDASLVVQALVDRCRARVPQHPEDRDVADGVVLELCNLADRGDSGAIATLREIERSGAQRR